MAIKAVQINPEYTFNNINSLPTEHQEWAKNDYAEKVREQIEGANGALHLGMIASYLSTTFGKTPTEMADIIEYGVARNIFTFNRDSRELHPPA